MSDIESSVRQIFHEVHEPNGLPFPQVVSRLLAVGVTRYHVDFVSSSVTTYGPDATFVRVDIPRYASPGNTWNVDNLRSAIRHAQQAASSGDTSYNYEGFVKRVVSEGGVTDYTAYLEGKRVLYMGAMGDTHVEWFPGAKPDEK